MKLSEGIVDILLDKLTDYILGRTLKSNAKARASYEKLLQSSDQYQTARKNIDKLQDNLEVTLQQLVQSTKDLVKARDEYADKYGEHAALDKYPMIRPRNRR